MDDPETLVSTDWLAARLTDPDLRIIDASWFLPGEGRDGRAEYDAGHIPRARFFDIDAIADTRSDLPHMAPPADLFAKAMREMGIGDANPVVVYDRSGIRSAARVWWTFRLMGRSGVAVLDGGFGKWQAEGRPVQTAAPAPTTSRERPMTVARQPRLVRDVTQVAAASKLGSAAIVDARPAARFRGEAAEPRPGLAVGHIPGARNLPFTDLLAPDGTLRPVPDLRAAFDAAGVDLTGPVITTCGSGVTASVLALALERIGHRDWAVYDGSWAEWGACPDLKIATGDA